MRAGGVVVAVAGVGAVVPVAREGALLLAVQPAVAGRAQARPVDGRAVSVVLAAARVAAALAEGEQRAGALARLAAPPRLALAHARPRVAHGSSVGITLAIPFTSAAPLVFGARALLALVPLPAEFTRARTVAGRTFAAVFAFAIVLALDAVFSHRTEFHTLFSSKPSFALAMASDVVATSAIGTLARFFTF